MRNSYKARRQQAIAELIRAQAVGSQDELAERLGSLGFAATQATISRDLEQIGALKTRSRGSVRYTVPEWPAAPASAPSRLGVVIRDWVRSIDHADNLIVLRTPPGSADLVGVALDDAAYDEIVGTICGDDTIFAACRSAAQARELVQSLRSLMDGAPPA